MNLLLFIIYFLLNDKQTLPGNRWKKLLRISLKRTVVKDSFVIAFFLNCVFLLLLLTFYRSFLLRQKLTSVTHNMKPNGCYRF